MDSFNLPVVLLASFFIAFFFFGLLGNLLAPSYLKQKLFSRQWWLYVFYVTVAFGFLYLLIFLTSKKEGRLPEISAGYIITIALLLFSITFYIRNKQINKILYWLSGLSILLISLYNLFFIRVFTFQVISGILMGAWILAYGPTGKLGALIQKLKKDRKAKEKT